jgi:hypothetical protein
MFWQQCSGHVQVNAEFPGQLVLAKTQVWRYGEFCTMMITTPLTGKSRMESRVSHGDEPEARHQ